jgi:hypothetical protein
MLKRSTGERSRSWTPPGMKTLSRGYLVAVMFHWIRVNELNVKVKMRDLDYSHSMTAGQ